MMRPMPWVPSVLWTACLLAACGGTSQVAPVSTSPGAAAGTAIAAGAVWIAGGGCRLQGCGYGAYCDRNTGLCVAHTCAKGCPSGTVCNEGLNRCQDAPPPRTPNDFLPQDNKLAQPPGAR